jgi:hypothetical protein
MNLASIERVESILPITGCDSLVLLTASHWKSLVPKDLFQVGDLCVVIKNGAIIPKWGELIGETPAGKYLKRNYYVVEKLYMKKHLSEALVLHPSIITYLNPGYVEGMRKPGQEIGDLLGLGFVDKVSKTFHFPKQNSISMDQNPSISHE